MNLQTALSTQDLMQPSYEEMVELALVDNEFFCRTFFPNTARQPMPAFHGRIWHKLEDPANRLVNIQVFRDGAKTSLLRMFAGKRIGYGISRTILYVSKSERHAIRSVDWLRKQVESNELYSKVFGLTPGRKWQGTEAEIYHHSFEHPIWVLGLGITGSTRGVNIDDYRPDLIVVDDVIDDENSATPEQREKVDDLILGALKYSLAPKSESPSATLAMLQTPMDFEDASVKALKDPEWTSEVFGCWTEATKDMPLEFQESIWPERYPSEDLRKEKQAALARNKLSVFMREKECRLISPEASAFRREWLKFYDESDLLKNEHKLVNILSIDPVPPPSEREVAKGLQGKNYEAFSIISYFQGDYYLREYVINRGHDPQWTISTFFNLLTRYRPRKVAIESIAYQRTLSWILSQEMKKRGQYAVVDEIADRRSKYDKIVDGLSGVASHGKFYVKSSQDEFINQFCNYPNVPFDDVIDSVAQGVTSLNLVELSDTEWWYEDDEKEIKTLEYNRGAP